MSQHSYFAVSTKKLDFLLSCVEKGCYGVAERTFREKVQVSFRQIAEGDRVFLRLLTNASNDIVCGPLVVSSPPGYVHFSESEGLWRKVNNLTTPEEHLPTWISIFPWCFFFDPTLTPQVNYCKLSTLTGHHFRLSAWGIVPPETGSSLWEFIEAYGSSFADFVQRIKPTVRLQIPIQPGQRIISGRLKSKRGVLVRSKSERLIDDWLYDHNIRAEYERCVLLDGYVIAPDFYLPDYNLYIEHLGLLDSNEDYRKDWSWKQSLYDKHNVKYVVLTEPDINDLDRSLTVKLKVYLK